jgi:hypothetical protein
VDLQVDREQFLRGFRERMILKRVDKIGGCRHPCIGRVRLNGKCTPREQRQRIERYGRLASGKFFHLRPGRPLCRVVLFFRGRKLNQRGL